MGDKFITITGFKNYYDQTPFSIGNLIRCSKEPNNIHDEEAIKCTLPMIGTVGYIANSVYTVAGGTMSAGRIYDQVEKRFYVRVMFTTSSKIICKVETGSFEELEKEMQRQMDKDWLTDGDE